MNRENENIHDDILVKYMLGEATNAEKTDIEQWLDADPANRKQYDHMLLIWQQSRELNVKSTVNVDQAWQQLMQRTAADEQAAPKQKVKTIPLYGLSWVRAAAMIVMLAGVGWVLYFLAGNGSTTISSGATAMNYTLPDGSVVTLNKNSELTYPKHFADNKRLVSMKGEAFFNITPNKAKPFVIDVNNVSVTVVGTSFNVKSSTAKTEVIVETGIVKVARQNKEVSVTPNQKATVLPGDAAPVVEQNGNNLYKYYRTNRFECIDIPLGEVAAALSDAYDVHISVPDARTRALLVHTTFEFEEEPLDEILKVLRETFSLTITRNGKEIVIK